MTSGHSTGSSHRAWRVAYRTLLTLLPPALREKHGDAMLELYERELVRSAPNGAAAVWSTGIAGLGDLLRRGPYERLIEERAALSGPSVRQLRQSVVAFVIAFLALTSVLVANYVSHHMNVAMRDVVLLSIPFTAALTVPMAVFMAVLWTATRGSMRSVPLIAFASVVAIAAFGLNTELVPRANRRLQALYSRTAGTPLSDRSMTLGELRAASTKIAASLLADRSANQGGAEATRRMRESLVN